MLIYIFFRTIQLTIHKTYKCIISKSLLILYNHDSLREVRALNMWPEKHTHWVTQCLLLPMFPTCSWLNTTCIYRCGAPRCSSCSHLGDPHTVTSCSNGFALTIAQLVNCHTRFVIYLITCIECNIQYVGRTTKSLSDRMRDHFSYIRTNKNTNIQ